MSLVRNERTKLTATYLNGIAIAPWIAFVQGASGRPLAIAVSSLICALLSPSSYI